MNKQNREGPGSAPSVPPIQNPFQKQVRGEGFKEVTKPKL